MIYRGTGFDTTLSTEDASHTTATTPTQAIHLRLTSHRTLLYRMGIGSFTILSLRNYRRMCRLAQDSAEPLVPVASARSHIPLSAGPANGSTFHFWRVPPCAKLHYPLYYRINQHKKAIRMEEFFESFAICSVRPARQNALPQYSIL